MEKINLKVGNETLVDLFRELVSEGLEEEYNEQLKELKRFYYQIKKC